MADDFIDFLKVIFPGFRFFRGYSVTHKGIDLDAPLGTPIKSVTSGKVLYAADTRDDPNHPWYTDMGGKVVVIDTGKGRLVEYAHMSKIDVTPGQQINVDTKLGEVGMTGNATGPHLHFAVLQQYAQAPSKVQFIDPEPFLRSNLGDNGNPTVEQFQYLLKKLGIPTDPDYILTHEDAVKIADQYGVTKDSSVYNDIVKFYEGKKVKDAIVGGNVNGSPLDLFGGIAGAINNFTHAITDPIAWLKLGAVAFGVVLIFKGASTIVEQSTATVRT